MARLLVSGLINLETTLRVEAFPVQFTPVHYAFDRVRSSISGVGFNVAKALHTLGHRVDLLALVGRDDAGGRARDALRRLGLAEAGLHDDLAETPHSVILYDGSGRRSIHVDLKDIQSRAYPARDAQRALAACDAAALCNINFSRALLGPARDAGRLVATDVHAVSRLDDEYNRDFMAGSDILFMSGDLLPVAPEAWAEEVMGAFGPQVLVIGLGGRGALLRTRGTREAILVPAARPPAVVSTIGAGDALFSGFLHAYLATRDALEALRHAVVFAAHKIGSASAADGFLTARGLADAVRCAELRA